MNPNENNAKGQDVDMIESAADASSGTEAIGAKASTRSSEDANEQIVHHLQTTGEEVGMTWRSFLAATVCIPPACENGIYPLSSTD